MLARQLFSGRRGLAAILCSLTLVAAACSTAPQPRASAPDPEAAAEPSSAGGAEAARNVEPRARPRPESTEPHPQLKPSAPTRYEVVKGDTLWDIATKFLDQPWYWPEIWHVNPQVENPHLIYPGDVLTLFYKGGRPYIQVAGGPRVSGLRTVRLSPRVRSESLTERASALPVQAIQQFIIRPRVVTEDQLLRAPHIVGAQDDRLIYGSGDRVYVRNLEAADEADRYSVFRPGKPLKDPETGELLGYEALPVSDASVVETGSPATVVLEQSKREALQGDRLLPLEDEKDKTFFPRAPDFQVHGTIVSLFDALSQIGQHQIAVIDRGTRNGIEKGHVLAVYQPGRVVEDRYARPGQSEVVALPSEKTGVMMVFRTFEKVSYGLVMDASRAIHLGDSVRNPK